MELVEAGRGGQERLEAHEVAVGSVRGHCIHEPRTGGLEQKRVVAVVAANAVVASVVVDCLEPACVRDEVREWCMADSALVQSHARRHIKINLAERSAARDAVALKALNVGVERRSWQLRTSRRCRKSKHAASGEREQTEASQH